MGAGLHTRKVQGGIAMRTKTSAEAWMARCLHDEIEALSAAVQMLAHQAGYHDGVYEAQVAA